MNVEDPSHIQLADPSISKALAGDHGALEGEAGAGATEVLGKSWETTW